MGGGEAYAIIPRFEGESVTLYAVTMKEDATTEQAENGTVYDGAVLLMRVLEQGSTDNGLLIPVWNFYGTRQRSFASGNTDETLHGIMLTINAIDGSIIDRALGY